MQPSSHRSAAALSWALVGLLVQTACGTPAGDPDAGEAPDARLDARPDAVPDAGRDGSAPDAGPPPDPCPDGCLVGEVCYPAGVASPSDPCAVCDPARSATAFSPNEGAVCDDGAFCTVGDACSATGECVGTPRSCDDGITCNGAERCDEAAATCTAGAPTCTAGQVCDAVAGECVLECTGCLIDGTCYGDGQVDPLNPCRVCDVAASRSSWSDRDGAPCDDGAFCTVESVCAGGTCGGGSPRACSNGIACDGVESCDEAADACVAGTSTCGTGQICDLASDACVALCTGCVIDGTCYGAGQRNPAEPCEVCAPAVSRDAWSPNDGARCDDGLFCTVGDTCSGTSCLGTARDCSDGVACNGAEACDEAAAACVAGTSTCGAGELCDVTADACVTTCDGCVIGGVCHADGTPNPLNECQVCDVARSTSAWSDADGASCDDGAFCTRDDVCAAGVCAGTPATFCDDGVACNGVETCDEAADRCVPGVGACPSGEICDPAADACVPTCDGCVIGGVCHADGARNPANPCEICAAATSPSGWTANVGASCDDGLFCTVDDACSDTAVCTGTARSCADGVSCNGDETCNEAADRCEAGSTTCASGQLCDPSTDRCETTCSGCVIGGVCHAPGATAPSNPCQVCDPASSAVGWTANVGASCDDGLFCTVDDTCSAAATCAGVARDCADGVTCNGDETCDEATDRCAAGTPTCVGDEVCDPAADACVLTCVGGTTRCDGACVDTDHDPRHCGGCGVTCAPWEICSGGACAAACTPGWMDCDGDTSNGCEAELESDVENCGACGNVCSTVHASALCAFGACELTCDEGWGDCNGDPADGCETDLSSALAHCGACGHACTGPSGSTLACDAGVCAFTVAAADVARWSTSLSATLLAIWADGTLHATGPLTTATVDPATGAVSSFPGPDTRSSVWIDGAGDSRHVSGGSSARQAYEPDGTEAWSWDDVACCNPDGSMALDPTGAVAYTSEGTELWEIDLASGAATSAASGGASAGRDALAGTLVWVAGFDGRVTLYDVASGTAEATVEIDPGAASPPRLHPGAVLSDGSFVVSSVGGVVARVGTDGTLAWSDTGYGDVSAPVVTVTDSGDEYIVLGTTTTMPLGISAFGADGSYVGTFATSGEVRSLAVADGDRIYALLDAGSGSGELVALDVVSGVVVETYTGLPTSGELLLRDGVAYVLGGGELHAIEVGATGYDPASPWPVPHHDNQRTSNAAAPLTY